MKMSEYEQDDDAMEKHKLTFNSGWPLPLQFMENF